MTKPREDYRMVTKEEIENLCSAYGIDSESDIYQIIEKLLAERDAYREVAINSGTFVSGKGSEDWVDAEAKMILSKGDL